ncbi:MAG: type-F conjugative transfer system protein TraW [Alphaproteobacteria bacterium]|nr:type-F conjugative transfer system protein TraW [Alphaproteobacteria bacterium]
MTAFLSTEYWALNTASARDLGTHGVIFPIEEEDPIQLIQQKLKVLKENGEMERHNRILQKKTIAAVKRPKPVEGITRATESRIFYYDPSYIVKEDMTDHQGRVFIKKGTKINPLETVSLSQNLLFFDGDDREQVSWAQNFLSAKKSEGKHQKEAVKLILIKGAPLSLSEEFKIPVYFDQGGLLIKKLGIQYVPAFVTQEDLRLRIEEVPLSSQKETEKGTTQ